MIVLLLVAVLAGAGTALSPCVLPVLPALLAASGTGGRRRPVGVVLGLTVTFGVTIIGLGEIVDGVGLGTTLTRDLAIVVLIASGLLLLLPRIADRLEAPLSRLARFGPRGRGSGFWSGVLVGAALGFVYAPCAGPILAAVVTVSAASGRTVAVGLAYALGSAAMLLAIALGGRTLIDRFKGPTLQRVLGVVLLVTALALITRVDLRFETLIARHAPDVSLTAGLESSDAVRKRLDDLRPARGIAAAAQAHPADDASGLRDYGPAPDFVGTQKWFNTADGQPLTLAQLRGRVVLVDFWTYTCINCLRTLPYLEAWDERYRKDGLTIVGVHAPEFGFEHDAGNVEAAIAANGIRYPVAQDNEMATWNAYGNQYWPAEYLIDKRGHVRHVQFGEGDYDVSERAIRSLLGETGADATPRGVVTPSARATPETYVGAARADPQQWATLPRASMRRYTSPGPQRLGLSQFALGGAWTVDDEHATAGAGATLDARVQARRVYLVLSPPRSGPGRAEVLVDGKPYRTVTVRRQQLYTLVDLPRSKTFTLQLRPQSGLSAFAFTFG